jgi:hypothetical protein
MRTRRRRFDEVGEEEFRVGSRNGRSPRSTRANHVGLHRDDEAPQTSEKALGSLVCRSCRRAEKQWNRRGRSAGLNRQAAEKERPSPKQRRHYERPMRRASLLRQMRTLGRALQPTDLAACSLRAIERRSASVTRRPRCERCIPWFDPLDPMRPWMNQARP